MLDPDAAPYRITADPSSLHLVPEYGVPEYGDGTALRIPLTQEPAVGPPGTPGTPTEPAAPTADTETADAETADAWAAHDRARAALATAAAHATGPEAGAEVEAAQRQMERAEERLWALGVPPEALADARTADARNAEMPVTAPGEQASATRESDLAPDEPSPVPGESAAAPGERAPTPGESAPAVPLDAELRQWLADRLTEADLPPVPEAPDGGETVTTADLRAAGITPSPGLYAEMTLLGDRLPANRLSAPDLARVRLTRPGDTDGTVRTLAAGVTRRLWDAAYAEVRDAAPEGRDDTETARAWSAAVTLVLPPQPHPVLDDARYAGDGFRDAVRRVAGHLLAAEPGAGDVRASAAELADSLRAELGLAPRWTVAQDGPTAAHEPPALQSGRGETSPTWTCRTGNRPTPTTGQPTPTSARARPWTWTGSRARARRRAPARAWTSVREWISVREWTWIWAWGTSTSPPASPPPWTASTSTPWGTSGTWAT
ncbi:hypothetical protein GTX14_23475 [Streptomyces sp. SID4944]|nr:hypothetical protein [Streptomyces sp. SID4944]